MPEETGIKDEIIEIGRRLYRFRMASAKGGNLSARLSRSSILITSSGACLGELKAGDILKAELREEPKGAIVRLSTEFPLHSLIYKNFPAMTIIHCHPPLINAYYSVYEELTDTTFESRLFLGRVPVVVQTTPSVTEPEKVAEALKTNNIVVIKNHGIVCIADKFSEGFYLVEELEQAVKTAGLVRLFGRAKPNKFEKELKKTLDLSAGAFALFSAGHISAIVDLINRDEDFLTQAKALKLTLKLAIKLDAAGHSVYKFHFQDGKIVKLEHDDDAPFVISGTRDIWRLIFLGRLDPFVATTQGKLKLKGELGRLSRWYAPFSRMFALFKEVRIK